MWPKIFPLPSWCYLCRNFIVQASQESRFLCSTCAKELPWMKEETCPICSQGHSDYDCEMAWAKPMERFYAVFAYESPIDTWVSRLKYGRDLMAGRVLRSLLHYWMQRSVEFSEYDAIIPMPIHWKRLIGRGFNQTDFLLHGIPSLPLNRKLIKRRKSFPHQTGLQGDARKKNLKNAFLADKRCNEKSILLFDDVCTTGRTFAEATKSLKKAQATTISALVLCRNV